MATFRVNKTKDFTVMSNTHLREKEMSLKAKGLLSLMLSLPENWDYSINGLEQIVAESRNTVAAILKELEQFKYLERVQIREKGKIIDWVYNIYEQPHTKNQDIENQDIEKRDMENCIQLNTNETNTNKSITKKERAKSSRFSPPSLEQVKEYCKERKNNIDAEQFIAFYASKGWKVGSQPMKDWKAAVITWEKRLSEKAKEANKNTSYAAYDLDLVEQMLNRDYE